MLSSEQRSKYLSRITNPRLLEAISDPELANAWREAIHYMMEELLHLRDETKPIARVERSPVTGRKWLVVYDYHTLPWNVALKLISDYYEVPPKELVAFMNLYDGDDPNLYNSSGQVKYFCHMQVVGVDATNCREFRGLVRTLVINQSKQAVIKMVDRLRNEGYSLSQAVCAVCEEFGLDETTVMRCVGYSKRDMFARAKKRITDGGTALVKKLVREVSEEIAEETGFSDRLVFDVIAGEMGLQPV